MDIQLATKESELTEIAQVMLQLRPQYSLESLIKQIKKQMNSGYQVAYLVEKDKIKCVAGFVIAEKFAWKKHLYVDDLVTDESSRSSGGGRAMLAWLKSYARDAGCSQLHLDSGVQKFAAHRFYLREGFIIASHHFSITNL
ncbi:GNAT family N-acetyltransferase [Aliikangiella sp. G2MR2-5]|uniref:GNAT family N-acetyltransferase n=1 Tax=Aliikangiella sp. G2MR2-5 TaxID=2788943 RepID=UPI0018AB0E2D|nr:GNAT family N-acetyltransferase [Aliikangiella sp. G2MR2-5]